MNTNISYLSFDDDEQDMYASSTCESIDVTLINVDELSQILLDCTLDQNSRTEIMSTWIKKEPIRLMDTVNEMCSSYTENETSLLAECLTCYSTMSFLPLALRLKCAMTVDDSGLICEVVRQSLNCEEDMNHTLCFTSCISCLADAEDLAGPLLVSIIGKKSLSCSYRYKLLLHLLAESKIGEEVKYKNVVVDCIHKLLYTLKEPKYLVFSAQQALKHDCLLLKDCEYMLDQTIKTNREEAVDGMTSDLAAAEICDFLLSCPIASDIKDKVKNRLLSIEGVDVIQLFKSNQTVHQVSSDIEGFVKDLMNYNVIPFATVCMSLKQHPSYNEAVENALNRFSLDEGLYSTMACSLSSILCRVYDKIQKHSAKESLMQRLCEECADMSDTCSSGHLVRLINVFSGIDGGITLSIRDEINSVMQHRISKLVSLQPIEVQEAIMEELDKDKQETIQKYLYKEMAILHNVMKQEYQGLLTDQEFTEYFRNAILMYTCV
jgi:hypothetical protein